MKDKADPKKMGDEDSKDDSDDAGKPSKTKAKPAKKPVKTKSANKNGRAKRHIPKSVVH